MHIAKLRDCRCNLYESLIHSEPYMDVLVFCNHSFEDVTLRLAHWGGRGVSKEEEKVALMGLKVPDAMFSLRWHRGCEWK